MKFKIYKCEQRFKQNRFIDNKRYIKYTSFIQKFIRINE